MRRGTTQTLTFTLPEEIAIDEVFITFRQNHKNVLEKGRADITINGAELVLNLTQADTLKLYAPAPVDIQIRLRDKLGNALASEYITTDVEPILKEGVI